MTLSGLMLTPMLVRHGNDSAGAADLATNSANARELPELSDPDKATVSAKTTPRFDPAGTGLGTFAAQWQMNDLLFAIPFENLRPEQGIDIHAGGDRDAAELQPPVPPLEGAAPFGADPQLPATATNGEHSAKAAQSQPPAVWFVVTSPEWREQFVERVSRATSIPPKLVPFQAARLLTGVCFLSLAVVFATRGANAVRRAADEFVPPVAEVARTSDGPEHASEPLASSATTQPAVAWLGAAFLTIAWFWLLLPVQKSVVLDVGAAAGSVRSGEGLAGRVGADSGLLRAFLAGVSLPRFAGARHTLRGDGFL